jgi:uncharacterized iron-regulated protein
VSAARRCLALAVGLLAGCASTPPPHALDGRIWDARAGQFIDESALALQLRQARFRLLGEMHDHPAHHRLRARLIAQLETPVDIFFEQFDLERDAALREAQLAGADADGLARAGALDAAWKWPLHRPLLEIAIARRDPVRAANLSRATARRIASGSGLTAADAAIANALAGSAWNAQREAALRAEIFEAHCQALPQSAAQGMALAQRARDATLAAALAGAAGSAVLIAGNGHARRDLAVPLYLPRDASVLSVGFLETRSGDTDPRDYARGASGEAAYDYVWFTPRQPRPDPCESLRKR